MEVVPVSSSGLKENEKKKRSSWRMGKVVEESKGMGGDGGGGDMQGQGDRRKERIKGGWRVKNMPEGEEARKLFKEREIVGLILYSDSNESRV